MFPPEGILFSSLAYAASISDNSLPGEYSLQAATSNLGLDHGDAGSIGSQTQRYNSTETPPATDDMVAQEASARGYRHNLKGPWVGGEKSSHDVREKHAKADPGYMAENSQLRQTYSHYRPLFDDANCRWRAMSFPYVGTFREFGSKDRIGEEYGSMPLTGSIETWCDHRKWIFEDIRDEVLSLLTDLAATIHVGPQSDSNSMILRRFSDEEVSSAIIYYFRLLAGAISKANSVTIHDLIPDGVGNFCKDMMEPLSTVTENPGVTILIDVLMNPMSIAVEIVYLNKRGTQVSSHLIRAEDDNGIPINPAGPIVHLLYQPGHNDILYKYTNASRSLRQQQIIDSASAASNIHTNHADVVNCALDPSPMSTFSLPGTVSIPSLSMAAMSNHGFPSAHTPLSNYGPILTPSYPFDTSVSTPNISAVSLHDSGTQIVPTAAPSNHSAPSRPQRSRSLHVKPIEVSPSSLSNQSRHAKSEYESDWNDPSAQVFQTGMFKNSHYNTAHYSNPDFQPEEWRPDDEEPCTEVKLKWPRRC